MGTRKPSHGFRKYYRTIFASFGYPLSPGACLNKSKLTDSARSLGVELPAALRDYYVVAGRERRFSRCHDRVLPPKHWRVDKGRLIFMEENQSVVWWRVSVRKPQEVDPPVSQAANDDELVWYLENRRCSVFLAVMLHYQAVCGGMPHCAQSEKPRHLKRKLAAGWTCYGTDNGLTAYSRRSQVVCIDPDMGILAGAKTKADLQAIEMDLEVTLS